MSDQKIVEESKVLAKFVGYVYVPFVEKGQPHKAGWYSGDPNSEKPEFRKLAKVKYLCRTHHELRFYNDWNWSMFVVEKIESLNLSDWYDEDNFVNVNVSIESGHCYILVELNYDPPHRITGESNYKKKKIHLVYDQLVKFINWYFDELGKKKNEYDTE